MFGATASIRVPASRDATFTYLSRIENVPAWATEFVRSFELDGETARIETPTGPAEMTIESDVGTGVIDFVVRGGADDRPVRFPARVVELPDRSSAFIFTIFPGSGGPPVADQLASLERELSRIPDLLQAA